MKKDQQQELLVWSITDEIRLVGFLGILAVQCSLKRCRSLKCNNLFGRDIDSFAGNRIATLASSPYRRREGSEICKLDIVTVDDALSNIAQRCRYDLVYERR